MVKVEGEDRDENRSEPENPDSAPKERAAPAPMPAILGRIDREKKTISAMMRIYCAHHHESAKVLCADCLQLLDYAHRRLDVCPFQDAKPACNHCQVHCYSATMRERVKSVMRYAGRRMVWRHPVLSLFHLLDKRIEAPPVESVKKNPKSR